MPEYIPEYVILVIAVLVIFARPPAQNMYLQTTARENNLKELQAWNNALHDFMNGTVVRNLFWLMRERLDRVMESDGFSAADVWRLGQEFTRTGAILRAERAYADASTGQHLRVALLMAVGYDGEVVCHLESTTEAGTLLANVPLLDSSTSNVTAVAETPKKVLRQLNETLKVLLDAEGATRSTSACNAFRNALNEALAH